LQKSARESYAINPPTESQAESRDKNSNNQPYANVCVFITYSTIVDSSLCRLFCVLCKRQSSREASGLRARAHTEYVAIKELRKRHNHGSKLAIVKGSLQLRGVVRVHVMHHGFIGLIAARVRSVVQILWRLKRHLFGMPKIPETAQV